jgi:phage terminase large subunit-like protein
MADDNLDLNEWQNWDQKSQEVYAAALEAALSGKKQAWYCKRGRKCDGQPHKGYDYPHARGDQWPPPGKDWATWLLKGGRGSGKTRSGSEYTRKATEKVERFALIGPTASHVRDVMVEGESGLIRIFERQGKKVLWEPSKRKITCPNGALIYTYSGEEPDRLRGPEHGGAWLDEPAHIPLIEPLWDNMKMGLRLGPNPQVLCTTTPLPTKWIKDLIEQDDTVTVTVSTYVNLANLSPTFRKTVLEKYEGTRLGRQELHGEILMDVEGALWSWDMIETTRHEGFDWRECSRIVVGIDPAGTSKRRDETGIVVVGVLGQHLYVLADGSGHYTPEGWADKAWQLFDQFDADAIVAEKNYGGEMVRSTLVNSRLNSKGFLDAEPRLVNSRRGKALRAEPIVGLYEQGRVHHVSIFEDMETQMTEWVPGTQDSPDRVDALVHAATDLAKPHQQANVALPQGRMDRNPFNRPDGFGRFGGIR